MTMLTMFDGNSRQPGDFGWDPMGLMSPANEERMKMRELQHGRLAMIAVLGELMAQKVPVAHRHAQTRAHARRHARDTHAQRTHAHCSPVCKGLALSIPWAPT